MFFFGPLGALALGLLLSRFLLNPSSHSVPSVLHQSLIYLSRPHRPFSDVDYDALARSSFRWDRESLLGRRADWDWKLNAAQVREAELAVARLGSLGLVDNLVSLNKTLMASMLPGWLTGVRRCSLEVSMGSGLCLIRGLPVDRWSASQAGAFFWGLGTLLGRPGAQNKAGDLLDSIRDTGADPAKSRLGYTNSDIGFHTDFADQVALLALHKAKSGGLSRIASSVHALVELHRQDPALADTIVKARHFLDTRGTSYPKVVPLRIVSVEGGDGIRMAYNSDYLRSSWTTSDLLSKDKTVPAELAKAYSALEAIASKSAFEMDLEPGDLQLISNHRVLHSRTGFEDGDTLETRRHLLRLWITETHQGVPSSISLWRELEAFSVLKDLALSFASRLTGLKLI
jgi:hypothetical protein